MSKQVRISDKSHQSAIEMAKRLEITVSSYTTFAACLYDIVTKRLQKPGSKLVIQSRDGTNQELILPGL